MSQPLSGPGRKRTTRARKGRGSAEKNPNRPEPRVLTTMRLRQSLRKDLEATAARNRRSVMVWFAADIRVVSDQLGSPPRFNNPRLV